MEINHKISNRENIQDILALTSTQEGILFHYLKDGNDKRYHLYLNVELEGKVVLDTFEAAWDLVALSNEVLRTVFRWKGLKNPVQIIGKKYDWKVAYYDCSGLNEIKTKEKKVKEKLQEQRLNLEKVPFSVSLFKLEENHFCMMLTYHHILFDGWSLGIILKEFMNAYEKFAFGKTIELPFKASLKDVIRDRHMQNKDEALTFWKNYLKDCNTDNSLIRNKKSKKMRGTIQTFQTEISNALAHKLNTFTKTNEVTLASVLYAGWALILQKYNDSDEVIFGTVFSGRPSCIKGIENATGLFIHTLPFRVEQSKCTLKMVKNINANLIEMEDFSAVPLVDIKACAEIKGNMELFDHIVVVENYPLERFLQSEEGSFTIKSYSMEETTNYNMTVSIVCHEKMIIQFLYDDNLFEKEEIKQLSQHYCNVLQNMMDDPQASPPAIDMLDGDEKDKILYQFNHTKADYPSDMLLHQFLEKQAEITPNNRAIIFKGESYTYQYLNERSNQLAWFLRKNNVCADTIVGIMTDRSLEMTVGIFGILKAGGAYMPLSSDLPENRLKYILSDSQVSIVLTVSEYIDKLDGVNVIQLEDGNSYMNSVTNPVPNESSHNLAYVIYTSGSTGKPKGVMMEHRAAVNRIYWMQNRYPLNQTDVILQKTTYMFDVSVWELFWWSFAGAALCLLQQGWEKHPEKIMEEIEKNKITTMHFVPSMLHVFLEYVDLGQGTERLKRLKRVFASGEALLPNQVDQFNTLFYQRNGTKLINLYGPTEAAIDVSCFDCSTEWRFNPIPIGKPIDNIHLYIVDRNLRPQPVRVPGELLIAGAGLARGYVNNPALTSEKFIQNSFINKLTKEQVMYKTGDVAQWLPDGNIEYLGRIDGQIKLRGYRIELGEIENNMLAYPGVKEAVASVKEDKNAEKYIVMYYVSQEPLEEERVKEFLGKRIPDYMIPFVFVSMECFPLTVNGKLDRKALERADTLVRQKKYTYVKPENEIEGKISRIWEEILGMKNIGVQDNFFDLGGNSLKMIRVTSKLSLELKKEITVSHLFTYPTIRALSNFISPENKTKAAAAIPSKEETNQEDNRVAVIGMAGRFPGAKNVEEFWSNLIEGKESISFFSKQEMEDAGIPNQLLEDANYVRAKGVLEEAEYFDASFFGYTKTEAERMDPQLRILHQCTFEALENAGYGTGDEEQSVGIYVGGSSNFHWLKSVSEQSQNSLEEFAAFIHNEKDFFSTRIAYKLNLRGPAITIQTACSTSMVAICTAYEGILAGKCELAVAGGIGLTYPLKAGYMYYDGMVFSPDGHCKAFSDSAKGTVPGNGAGVVVLKRLDAAVRDGDSIYAAIKGAAVNNDGARKVGYTAPSVEGQAEVIRSAMQMAGVKAQDITYIETHGTGTELGDLVEIEALKQAFNIGKNTICRIGSVKTNLGHLDSASGVAGFIKTVLLLKNRLIPPSLHYEKPNPKIDFENSPFRVNTENMDLSNYNGTIKAGVNSFGIGGTNAHIVLEEAPVLEKTRESRQWNLILLSAKTEMALDRMSYNLKEWLEKNGEAALADVAYTLQAGRKNFGHRKMFVCKKTKEAIEYLNSNSKSISYICSQNKKHQIVFMLAGIGSQYCNMGRELYETEPVFRTEMNRCFAICKEIAGLELKEILYPQDSKFNEMEELLDKRTDINQPIVFAFEYVLAKLMMTWGIKPDAMIGYSFGEYVAACISGVFRLRDALDLVMLRGKLIEETKGGAMLSIPLPAKEILPLLKKDLWIAVDNGPTCIVSGGVEAISDFEKEMKNKRYICTRMRARHAIHSPMMEPAKKKLEEKLNTLVLYSPKIPYISDITGTWITVEDATDPRYWAKHLCDTVEFADGMRELLNNKNSILVEIGPNRDLCVLARHYVEDISKTLVINLIRSRQEKLSDVAYLLNKVGQLWLNGIHFDWKAFYQGEKRYRIGLPTYPFEKNYYMPKEQGMIGVKDKAAVAQRQDSGERKRIDEWLYTPTWERDERNDSKIHTTGRKRTIVIFCDDGEICGWLKEYLEALGHAIVCVKKGQVKSMESKSVYFMRIGSEKDYIWLLEEFKKAHIAPDEIIHLWGVNQEKKEAYEERLNESLELYYYSLLYSIKEMAGQYADRDIQWNIVTNDMQEVTGDEKLVPEKSVALGVYHTIPLEYPKMKCKCIDFSIPDFEDETVKRIGKQIAVEIHLEDREVIVAYRGKYRWVQNYKEYLVSTERKKQSVLKEEGVYLITGGLGGMGGVFAEYLAQTVHARLVLIGRSAFPARKEWDGWLKEQGSDNAVSRKIKQLKELEKAGAKVLVYRADISKQQDLEEVAEDAQDKFGNINGIIHAAGTADGCMISFRTKQMSEDVFASKIRGTKVLEQVFQNKKLDFLLLCSSLSSVLWTFGQVAYCSANAFENTFARYWNSKYDSIATSISWDTWLEVGMAVEAEKRLKEELGEKNTDSKLMKDGIHSSEGKRILQWALEKNIPQIIVSIRSLKYVQKENYTKGTSVSLEDLADSNKNKAIHKRPVLTNKYIVPLGKTEEQICMVLQEYFGMEQIGVEDNFFDLGASSLDIIRLSVKIKEIIKKEVPVITMFRYPTIRLLAEFITDEKKNKEVIDRKEQVKKGKRNLNNRLHIKKGENENI